MNELTPCNISLPDVVANDQRIGHLLAANLSDEELPKAVFVGFCSDEGVRRNGGRPGAAQAPNAIRRHLYSMTPDAENPEPFTSLISDINDVGNVEVSGNLEEDQEVLGKILASYIDAGVIPIILGGGHETAFGHFLGYAKSGIETAILNIDAHTDVRALKNEQAHSGSPFRQAIEHESGCCSRYLAAGLQPHAVAKSHLDYIDTNGGQYKFRDETNITSISSLFHMHESDHLMVTFDMDAVDQAFAPGVSAPCTNGLKPELWLTAAYLAGRNEQVSSFEISEYNPECDRDEQTARLAALTVWNFMLGLSQR